MRSGYQSKRGTYFGEHNLDFRSGAITTSDVPCPRCSKLIISKGISMVVIPGKMSLTPTYYEVADLYYLLKKGVVVVNEHFLSTDE